MNVAFFTEPGFEQDCAATLPGKSIIKPGVILADLPDQKEDMISYYYMLQWTSRILVHALVGPDVEFIQQNFKIPSWFTAERSFKVHASGFDDNAGVAHELGGYIHDQLQCKVNLDNPDVLIVLRKTGDELVCGIDLAQMELQKREYRIYTNPAMLRSSFAYCLLLLGKYEKKHLLLDPFCGSGTIPIEAAIAMTQTSPHRHRKQDFLIPRSGYCSEEEMLKVFGKLDKKQKIDNFDIFGYDHLLTRVKACNHNAKIAGILDALEFSRVDLEWLDTKFDENSVDLIVTNPPLFTQMGLPTLRKLYGDFFRQASLILKKNGRIVIATNHEAYTVEAAAGFGLKETRQVLMGQQPYVVMLFERQ